jgi:hypothetical protein
VSEERATQRNWLSVSATCHHQGHLAEVPRVDPPEVVVLVRAEVHLGRVVDLVEAEGERVETRSRPSVSRFSWCDTSAPATAHSPVSSQHSRTAARAGVSPTSTVPPGMSHCPPR